MTRRQYATLVVLSVIAAFVGGMVSARLPSGMHTHAAADKDTRKLDTLEVRVLKVVDKEGRPRAWLGMEEGDPLLVMESGSGEPRMVLGAHERGASLSLTGDERRTGIAIVDTVGGRVVWRAPQTLQFSSDM
jgi:hypothetical protein